MVFKRGFRARGVPAALLLALYWGPQARAQETHAPYPAEVFRFDQIDAVCVVPVIGHKVQTFLEERVARYGVDVGFGRVVKRSLDTEAMRPIVMLALEKRGYRVEDPRCSEGARGGAPGESSSRWLLTVILDGYELFGPKGKDGQVRNDKVMAIGIMLSASLFDTRTRSEVWKDSATGHVRAMRQWNFTKGLVPIAPSTLFASAVDSVLGTFEKRGEPAPSLDVTSWPPLTVRANIFTVRSKSCLGTLQAQGGTVSFTPDDAAKCQKYQFSAARSQVSYGLNRMTGVAIPTAFHVILPGAGTVNFCNADEGAVNYFFAGLGSGR